MFRKLFITMLALLLVAGVAATAQAQSKTLRWGTSSVGSSGHRAITTLVEVLRKEMPDYEFAVQPTPGAILTVKGYATGQFEGYYGSDIAFYELANSTSRFEGFKEQAERMPVQSFWAFSVDMAVGIHASNADKYDEWRDLSGQPVFTGPRPWDTRAQLKRAFNALGIKHQYREVSIDTAGSLLESGRIEAFGPYTNSRLTTAPWINEVSLQTDWVVLNPSAEEIEILENNGLSVVDVDPTAFGQKDNYAVETVKTVPFLYGLHVGTEIPADDVYRMLNIIEENADALAESDRAFQMVADDMEAVQVQGVNAALNLVEIHPGLQRWMQEKGIWQSKWNSRVAN